MSIIFLTEIFKYLDKSFVPYIREIDSLQDKYNRNTSKVYSYDLYFDQHNQKANQYMKNSPITNTCSFISRNKYTKEMIDDCLNFSSVIKNDVEIIFLRSENQISFLNFFKEGYRYFRNNRIEAALDSFHTALMFKNHDFLTIKYIKKLEKKKLSIQKKIATCKKLAKININPNI